MVDRLRLRFLCFLGACSSLAQGCGVRSADVFSVEQTTSYYLSPDGSDQNPGTVTAPWKTFAHAIPLLLPGNTLILLDGIYDGATSGYPDIRCGTNAQNGAFGRPITLRAAHERQAFLKGDGSAHPFHLSGCSDWTIEGLHVENGDFPREIGEQPGTVLLFENAKRLTLRRLLAARSNRNFGRSCVLLINDGSSAVLVEESEFYDFHWAGVRVAKTSSATLRRNYANSRNYADLGTTATRYPAVG